MEQILANDAGVLELFEENPFKAYIEIGLIRHDRFYSRKVEGFKEIEFVKTIRGFRNINSIINGIHVVGYLVIVAVA